MRVEEEERGGGADSGAPHAEETGKRHLPT